MRRGDSTLDKRIKNDPLHVENVIVWKFKLNQEEDGKFLCFPFFFYPEFTTFHSILIELTWIMQEKKLPSLWQFLLGFDAIAGYPMEPAKSRWHMLNTYFGVLWLRRGKYIEIVKAMVSECFLTTTATITDRVASEQSHSKVSVTILRMNNSHIN